MTLLLNCQEIGKAIGPRSLFEAVSFTVSTGERLGIIGANGSGKTTLLRILAGLEPADSGRITVSSNMLIGYLPQEDNLDGSAQVADILLDGLRDLRLDDAERHNRVQAVLSRAEFADEHQLVHTLSGGWKKRLAICRALIREPDLLIMDEPTNHLDIEGILWLEKILKSSTTGSPSALVMVSHDRSFLNSIADRVMELSPLYPEGFLPVNGNYSEFLRQKERFLALQLEQETRMGNKLRREKEWLSRGPKARATKAKYRTDEAYRLQEEFNRIRARNRVNREIEIDFTGTGRRSKKLLEARGLSKSFGDRALFADLDLVLSPGFRLGLLGRNGCGKSTLLRMLATEELAERPSPDQGTVRTAEGVNIVYFAQNREKLDPQATLKQELSPEGDSVLFRGQSLHVVTWAQKFLFRPDQLDTPVGSLSGGEQARILIAGLMRRPADILLLDEPTNDLDIPSLQVLEDSLLEFPGAVVLVTHDRYLMNRVCSKVLGFLDNGLVTSFASFDQWLEAMAERKSPKPAQPQPAGREKKSARGKLSYLDQREYDAMEETISAAEAKEQALTLFMEQPEIISDPQKLQESWQQLEELRQKIDRLYQRWDELEAGKNSADG